MSPTGPASVGLGVGVGLGEGVGLGVGVGLGLAVGLGRSVAIVVGIETGCVGATDVSQPAPSRAIAVSSTAIGPTRFGRQAVRGRPSTGRLYPGWPAVAGEPVDYYGSPMRTRRLA